jgi:hypothetical protein
VDARGPESSHGLDERRVYNVERPHIQFRNYPPGSGHSPTPSFTLLTPALNLIKAHDSAVRAMEWSNSGTWLVSGDNMGTLKYFQVNMNNLQVFSGHSEAVRDVSFAPNDARFVTGGDDSTIKIWSFEEMREEKTWTGAPATFSFSAFPRRVFFADDENVTRTRLGCQVCQVASDERPFGFWGQGQHCQVLGPADDKGPPVSVRRGLFLFLFYFFPFIAKKWKRNRHGHKNTIQALAWNPNGNTVATASRDSFLKVYDIRAMKELHTFRGHKKEVCCTLFAGPYEECASQLSDKIVCLSQRLHGTLPITRASSLEGRTDPSCTGASIHSRHTPSIRSSLPMTRTYGHSRTIHSATCSSLAQTTTRPGSGHASDPRVGSPSTDSMWAGSAQRNSQVEWNNHSTKVRAMSDCVCVKKMRVGRLMRRLYAQTIKICLFPGSAAATMHRRSRDFDRPWALARRAHRRCLYRHGHP